MRRQGMAWLVGMVLSMVALTGWAAEEPATTETNGVKVEQIDAPKSEDDALAPLRHEQEKLSVQAQLETARLERELATVNAERKRLAAELDLLQQRHANELAGLKQEAESLRAEIQLKESRRDAELTDLRLDTERLRAQMELQRQELAAELECLRQEKERLAAEMDVREQQQRAAQASLRQELEQLGLEASLRQARLQDRLADGQEALELLNQAIERKRTALEQQRVELDLQRAENEAVMTAMQADIAERELREKWTDAANEPITYTTDPWRDGYLEISDRRVMLDGPIYYGVADYIAERINYFNNVDSSKPIFIVIGDCPGGSVVEGVRIIKAMQSSTAPMHVVVKSFAASMGAVITAMADQSYAYPNAMILHHQISSGMYGNVTQQEERLQVVREWARRVLVPVAEKMGLTYDEFVRQMYEHNSDGDWMEFADRALELNWIDHVIVEARELGFRTKPSEPDKPGMMFFLEAPEQTDPSGAAYVQMPPLRPFDLYYMYNPTDYYRW